MKTRKPYRDGKVHVCEQMCATCIFRPGNLMYLEPGRVKDMVDSSIKRQSAIICHDTLDGFQAVCRGFFDNYKTDPLQLAERMGVIRLQPPKGETHR